MQKLNIGEEERNLYLVMKNLNENVLKVALAV